MDHELHRFPDGFIWGSAVSGHQIEGNNRHSNWWHWELATPAQPESGRAIDYLNRYEEDHDLLVQMGHTGFRMGIEWARLEPRRGTFSSDAIELYHRILQDLKSREIKVCLTIHHWVLPQWVAEQGGWCNPGIVDWFCDYVRTVVKEFSCYADFWITLNEPMVAALAGYLSRDFPPQHRNIFELRRAVQHMLQAHAAAYRIIHEHNADAAVSIAMAYTCLEPWGSCGFAGWYERKVAALGRHLIYGAWDESIRTGRVQFPYGRREIDGLRDSIDFCGINYYFRMTPRYSIKHARTGLLDLDATPDNIDHNDFGWQVWPEGIRTIIDCVWQRFGKPIFITENGIADKRDTLRGRYIVDHLHQILLAIEDGIPVKGYYHWSLVDNFEWKEGFEMCFGLVAIDADDPHLERKPRPSAALYSQIIRENGIRL